MQKDILEIDNQILISLQENEKIIGDDYIAARKVNEKSISLSFKKNKI
jgi:uncharacterized protein YuzE